MVELIFVRHGQTDWNTEGRTQGHSDIPLNQEGKDQAQLVAERLKSISVDAIISSDLERAYHTAEAINNYHNVSIEQTAELRELCFGNAEGRLSKDVIAENPDFFDSLKDIESAEFWEAKLLNSESKKELLDRFYRFLKDYINKNPEHKKIVVVTHGHAMHCVYADVFKDIRKFKNTEYISLYWHADKNKLQGHPFRYAEIQTPRLRLRTPLLSDTAYWAEYFNNWNVVKEMTSSISYPFNQQDAMNYLIKILYPRIDQGNAIGFVIERKEKNGTYTFMGVISYERDSEQKEVGRGFWLGEPFHGEGYMSEATSYANKYVAEKMAVSSIYTRSAVSNIASNRIKEKEGWVVISKGKGLYKLGELEEYKWRLDLIYDNIVVE